MKKYWAPDSRDSSEGRSGGRTLSENVAERAIMILLGLDGCVGSSETAGSRDPWSDRIKICAGDHCLIPVRFRRSNLGRTFLKKVSPQTPLQKLLIGVALKTPTAVALSILGDFVFSAGVRVRGVRLFLQPYFERAVTGQIATAAEIREALEEFVGHPLHH